MMKLLLLSIKLILTQLLWAQSHSVPSDQFINNGTNSFSMNVEANASHYDHQNNLHFSDQLLIKPNNDSLLIEKAISSPTHQNTIQSNLLQLFPSQTYGQLVITGHIPNEASFTLLSPVSNQIFTLFPKNLSSERYRLFAEKIELAFLSPGLYYVCVEQDDIQCIPWLKE